MATKEQDAPDTKLVFIKVSRVISYFVYGFSIIASVFLGISFVLLLFSANTNTAFVKFVYETSATFLAPFREIFPVRAISDTGYFSPSILFAIMMYMILALAMNALISYITLKMVKHEKEISSSVK